MDVFRSDFPVSYGMECPSLALAPLGSLNGSWLALIGSLFVSLSGSASLWVCLSLSGSLGAALVPGLLGYVSARVSAGFWGLGRGLEFGHKKAPMASRGLVLDANDIGQRRAGMFHSPRDYALPVSLQN